MSRKRSSIHEAFLQNIPLALVVNNEKQMKSIDINSTLQETLISLSTDNYEALPVFDAETLKYEYVASRLDIISMVAWTQNEGWKKSPLLDVLQTEEHVVDPRIFEFTMNDAVIACLEPFSKGVHHILIKNEEYQQFDDTNSQNDNSDEQCDDEQSCDAITEQQYYFVSQFEIVAFLYQNIQRMSAIVEAPINLIGLVKERNLQNEEICTVHYKILAKDAFKKFLVNRCDVIAIINDTKQIISHISESDIIGVGPEAIHFLLTDEYLTVYDFMCAVNKENNRKNEPVTCLKNEIFKTLIKIVLERKSNHIFIVDDNKKPLKVITVNDIICKFSPYDYKTNKASERLSMIAEGNVTAATKILRGLSLDEVKEDGSSNSDGYE